MTAMPAKEALERLWKIWSRIKALDTLPKNSEAYNDNIHDIAKNLKPDTIFLLDLASLLLQEKIEREYNERD